MSEPEGRDFNRAASASRDCHSERGTCFTRPQSWRTCKNGKGTTSVVPQRPAQVTALAA